jgi:hypothetical protein
MREKHQVRRPLALAASALLGAGCLPSIADLDTGPLNSTFAVSDFFAPSGYMGDGEYFGDLVGLTNEGCLPRPAGARGNCYAFTYYPNNVGTDPWAGAFWVFPSNSWGSSTGHAIDVTRFKQVRFYAAIDGPSPYTVNGSPQNFSAQAGGIDPMNFYNNKDPLHQATDYVDGLRAGASWALPGDMMTGQLKPYHIPLDATTYGYDCQLMRPDQDPATFKPNCITDPTTGNTVAKYLIGAFAWALHYPTDSAPCKDGTTACHMDNLHSADFVSPKPVHIYLDDIVWDTEPPPAP